MASDPNDDPESPPTRSSTPPGGDANADAAALPTTISGPGRSDEAVIPQVPGYEILELIGQGGMGLVYRVRDTDLLRDIVLKTPKPPLGDHVEVHRRFLEEAKITAQLQHPGIPPVHEIGMLPDGRPFLTMKLVKGETLAARLKARDDFKQRLDASILASIKQQNPSSVIDLKTVVGDRAADLGPVADLVSSSVKQVRGADVIHLKTIVGDPERFLRYFEQICETIAYAHDRGVIHRDLKPGNIMIGQFGEVQVMDWGLAKKLPRDGNVDADTHAADPQTTIQSPRAGSADYTRGALGTWAYASPEQARGQVRLMDHRSDVFSLGAVLCEILTGAPPYSAHPSKTVAELAQDGDLAAAYARLGAPGIPAKLVELAKACLSVDRDARPANAQAVYVAVKEYHEELARSAQETAKALVKAQEERKRRRTLARSFAAIAASLLIGTGVAIALAIYAYVSATKAQKAADAEKIANDRLKQEKDAADKARDDAEDFLTQSRLQLARARFEEANVALAEELVDLVPPKSRDSAWKLVKNGMAGSPATLRGHQAGVWSVAFTPDGLTLASASADKTLKLWDARTGHELRILSGHESYVTSVAFTPDGLTLASASRDKTVKLWDARTGKELRTLRQHEDFVTSVAFTPDGLTLASASSDKTVKLWDTRTGQELRSLRGHQNFVRSVAFTPDGRTLASAGDAIVLWDTNIGQALRTLRGLQAGVESVAFTPDGRTLASASSDNTVKLWDVRTGQELRTLRGHQNWVHSVAFTPDGLTLASGSSDNTVRLWDARTGLELRALRGHQGAVMSVAFTPDGMTLASASVDQMIKLWDARTGQELRTLRGLQLSASFAAFSPDGLIVASATFDKTVKLWDARTGQELRSLPGHHGIVMSAAFTPDSLTLASASFDKTVKLWDTRTGHELRTLPGHPSVVTRVAFMSDGRTLASASLDGTVMLWDARTGQVFHTLRAHTDEVMSVAFTPDGLTLASASLDQTIKLWDTRTGQELRTLRGHQDWVSSVAFTADGRTLASAGGDKDRTVRLWDVSTGRELRALRGHQLGVNSVAFAPDGLTLASASSDQTVKLWDARTGQELRTLRGHRNHVTSVAFTPDGRTLASASWDNTVKLWDVRTGPLDGDLQFRLWVFQPYLPWNKHEVDLAEQRNESFAAVCHLGNYLLARNRLQHTPWDPAAAVHVLSAGTHPFTALAGYVGLEDGRHAQTAFVDGATFAGILLKDSGRSAKGLVVRSQWAVEQWPNGWRNREVLGGALYRAGDYQGAVQELFMSHKLREKEAARSGNRTAAPSASNFSCHFLALAHHQLGNKDEAAAWRAKAVLHKDAPWDDAMIDRYLRREVEAEMTN